MSIPTPIARAWTSTSGFFGAFFEAAFASLSSAVVMSSIVHVTVIFAVGIKAANPELFQNFESLEVTLVNARSETAPLKAEVLAQHNLDGGGDVEEDRHAQSPLPASEHDAPQSAGALETRIRALETKARELMARARSDYALEPERAEKDEPPRPVTPTAADLAANSLEQARLMARITENYDAYQKRPRRDNAHARAREFSFARYVEDWRIKVEAVGNRNYPEAAKRDRIYGTLILSVDINADGSLADVQIDKSSGSKVLDAAAINIVTRSAPFAPFPEEMRRQVDIFSITRAWQFTSSDRLQSGTTK